MRFILKQYIFESQEQPLSSGLVKKNSELRETTEENNSPSLKLLFTPLNTIYFFSLWNQMERLPPV